MLLSPRAGQVSARGSALNGVCGVGTVPQIESVMHKAAVVFALEHLADGGASLATGSFLIRFRVDYLSDTGSLSSLADLDDPDEKVVQALVQSRVACGGDGR